MSRFFNYPYSSDSDDVTTDSELYSDEAPSVPQLAVSAAAASKYARGAYDSSDDDSQDFSRKVKSSRDKMSDKFEDITEAFASNDFPASLAAFETLTKLKFKQADLPKLLVKSLAILNALLLSSPKPDDLAPAATKAYNVLRQKFRKLSPVLSAAINDYHVNPQAYDEADGDSDDSMFDDDSSSSSDSDSDIDPTLTGRSKWLKKPEKEKKVKVIRPTKTTSKTQMAAQEDDGFQTVGKKKVSIVSPTVVDITEESLYSRLASVLEARGKKNTDKNQQVTVLRQLNELAASPYQKIRVLLALIPAEFDVSSSTAYMNESLFKTMTADISGLLHLMESNAQIIVKDGVEQLDTDSENEQKLKNGETVFLLGNIGSFVDRLDQEFNKSMQSIDIHSAEYVERLRVEFELYALIVRAMKYYTENKNSDAKAIILNSRLEHIYYKPLSLIRAFEKKVGEKYPTLLPFLQSPNPVEVLCDECYALPYDRLHIKAALYQAYHYALHNNYEHARDIILYSRVQETILSHDIPTQSLYNRTIAQVGISAFTHGHMRECVFALHDLFTNNRARELLAQSKQHTPYVPFHMHIQVDLLECVFMTASMFLEIPNYCQVERKKIVLSKPFKKLWDFSERTVFMGSPETSKEKVLHAAKAMIRGDWEFAEELVLGMPVWQYLEGKDNLLKMLRIMIKKESMRAYLLTSQNIYAVVSLPRLSAMFEMSAEDTKKTVSDLIQDKNLIASLDADNLVYQQDTVHKVEALKRLFYDKEPILSDYIEKLGEAVKKMKKKREVVA